MNKDLYNKEYDIPSDVIESLQKGFDEHSTRFYNTSGYKKNINLRNNKKISYQLLKNNKNKFESGNLSKERYELMGGDRMKNWVNMILNQDRQTLKTSKKHRMDSGLSNSFIKTHTKNPLNGVRPSLSHKKTSFRHASSIFEDIERINEIIKIII